MAALLLRHSRNTSCDVYRAAAARASAILFAASHSTVAWLSGNCCKQTPYCLQHARHNMFLTEVRKINRQPVIYRLIQFSVLSSDIGYYSKIWLDE
jgi:hypothetical protein